MSCIHKYKPSEFEDYERCQTCGTLHHLNPIQPDEAYLNNYWSEERGHSNLEAQAWNCDVHEENGLTKNQFVLNLLPEFSPYLLEIGCAPGSTLRSILDSDRASWVTGSDYDPAYEEGIREIINHPVELVFGPFPKSFKDRQPSSFNTIVGLDVFEHNFDPDSFLKACQLLLNNNGFLLLMLPLVSNEGEVFDRMRHREHVFLHSKKHMEILLKEHGFKDIAFSQWCQGHDCVTAIKA